MDLTCMGSRKDTRSPELIGSMGMMLEGEGIGMEVSGKNI